MFWGCITAEGPGYGSNILEGNVNASAYVEILESNLLDTLDYYGMTAQEVHFQQDKAPAHTSSTFFAWFHGHGFSKDDVLDWPAQSPDLNPIEHVWAYIKRQLEAYPTRPTSKDDLAERLDKEWNKLTKEDCLRYIDSMPKRIKAVIAKKGGPTSF